MVLDLNSFNNGASLQASCSVAWCQSTNGLSNEGKWGKSSKAPPKKKGFASGVDIWLEKWQIRGWQCIYVLCEPNDGSRIILVVSNTIKASEASAV